MKTNTLFTLRDLEQDCEIQTDCYRLDDAQGYRALGMKIVVPAALYHQAPYNASAYTLMQQLRQEIFDVGIVEFPGLPVNKTNHTLAQRSPKEHAYSDNSYLTDVCQRPHQDVPPYPSGFWLGKKRKFSATWVLSLAGVQTFLAFCAEHPTDKIEDIHKTLVQKTIAQHTGLLLNQQPGLLLIDNSARLSLYHARTCNFDALNHDPGHSKDTPMYAYNEPGLLHYIDTLDSRRGPAHRDPKEMASVRAFIQAEKLSD